jgi:hypothetical protein
VVREVFICRAAECVWSVGCGVWGVGCELWGVQVAQHSWVVVG